jgi:hypothetical protein
VDGERNLNELNQSIKIHLKDLLLERRVHEIHQRNKLIMVTQGIEIKT